MHSTCLCSSHLNGIEVTVVIVDSVECFGLTWRLPFQTEFLYQLDVVWRKGLTFGHDVIEKVKSVTESLRANAPTVVFTSIYTFAEVRLGKSNGNESATGC